MAASIVIEINEKKYTLTQEKLIELARKGSIKPETKIWVNGKLGTVGQIPGLSSAIASSSTATPPPILCGRTKKIGLKSGYFSSCWIEFRQFISRYLPRFDTSSSSENQANVF